MENAVTHEEAIFTIGMLTLALVDGVIGVMGLRKTFPSQRGMIFAFYFLMGIVLPYLGILATIVSVLVIRLKRVSEPEIAAEKIGMEELVVKFPHAKRTFGEGAMSVLLGQRHTPSQIKIRALSVLGSQINRKHLSVIKQALSDKADEVRLFSFSIIDRMEKRINVEIHQRKKTFETASDEREKLMAAKELASLYWDLVYFELADETLRNFLVEESKKYIHYVLERDYEDLSMHILLGKVYLQQGDDEEAQREFTLVLESDEQRYSFITPYLAELFFKQKNYRSVKSLMTYEEDLRFNMQLHPIVDLWAGR
jgi:tetratricopeptide (TPR) repeat protein